MWFGKEAGWLICCMSCSWWLIACAVRQIGQCSLASELLFVAGIKCTAVGFCSVLLWHKACCGDDTLLSCYIRTGQGSAGPGFRSLNNTVVKSSRHPKSTPLTWFVCWEGWHLNTSDMVQS
jgi:hypothetical protein